MATGGYGTALGVIRALKELGHLSLAYCTETRPYNQGSRLTAYELVYEEIPAKLICDSAVSALMSTEVSTKYHNIGAVGLEFQLPFKTTQCKCLMFIVFVTTHCKNVKWHDTMTVTLVS